MTLREVNDLAEYALAGPGVVFGRAMYRLAPETLKAGALDELLSSAGMGFSRIS